MYHLCKAVTLFLFIALIDHIATAQDAWTTKANLAGDKRSTAVSFVIDQYGYVGLGAKNFTFLKDFWRYDPLTDSWMQAADYGGGKRVGPTSFVIDKTAYVLTGSSGNGKTNDMWAYDADANQWTQKDSLPGAVRNYSFAFAIGNKGYVLGGFGTVDNIGDFWRYDPLLDSWDSIGVIPGQPRSSAMGFVIDGTGYFGGGYGAAPLDDFWAYDTLSGTWTQKASITAPISDAGSFMINGRGYICSGYVNSSASNQLIEYDPVTDTWTTRASIPGDPKTDPIALAIGDLGYTGTGYNDQFASTQDFYEYNPDTSVATSIQNVSSHISISVSPNPIQDRASVIITFDKPLSDITAMLLSPDGKSLPVSFATEPSGNKNEWHISFIRNELAASTYFLQVWSGSKLIGIEKVIVQ